MNARRRLTLIGPLGILALVTAPRVSSQSAPTIGSYQLISEVRVTRDVSEYTYRAVLTAAGQALSGATATAVSVAAPTTIVDGSLTFGPVAAGGTVTSTDTFSFRHNRTVPFNWANIRWTI